MRIKHASAGVSHDANPSPSKPITKPRPKQASLEEGQRTPLAHFTYHHRHFFFKSTSCLHSMSPCMLPFLFLVHSVHIRLGVATLGLRARFSCSVIVHHRLAVNAVSASLASPPALPVWRTAQLSAVLASLSLKSWIS